MLHLILKSSGCLNSYGVKMVAVKTKGARYDTPIKPSLIILMSKTGLSSVPHALVAISKREAYYCDIQFSTIVANKFVIVNASQIQKKILRHSLIIS